MVMGMMMIMMIIMMTMRSRKRRRRMSSQVLELPTLAVYTLHVYLMVITLDILPLYKQ